MSELYMKSLHKLELDQILTLLAECAGSSEGKAACLRVQPSSDLTEVQDMLNETSAASDLCTRKGNPSFSDVKDVGASLERADIEVPNHSVDMSSWEGSACYPRSTFYPLSDVPSIRKHRITMLWFPTCSTC